MEDYKANSHKSKEELASQEEKKKLEPVVKGEVKRKKNSVRTLTNTFVSEDIHNIKSYVVMDVLVPAIKKAVFDIVSNGIEMILYGEAKGGSKRSSGASTVSYRSYYDDRRDERKSSNRERTYSGYSYDDLIFGSRSEAEEVLSRMDEIIDEYKIVSVADMYDLAGVSSNYTDNNYGWINIRNAEVIRVKDDYIIKMPKALPIK